MPTESKKEPQKESRSLREFFLERKKSHILTKIIIPLFIVCASLATISPQRIVKGDLKLGKVMSNVAQDLDAIPELTATVPEGATRDDCPGPDCPLNPGDPNKNQRITWEPSKNYLAERANVKSWRGYHYSRIDTTLPAFAAKKGAKVAFDILGIAGKSWRFFVNGVEKASGKGAIFDDAIVFDSDGGTPGEPMVIGFEVQAGRNFAPGIIYLSQPFLSPPEIAPVIRTAYRGNDKEVVLPDAYARATVGVIAALGCLFTPFHFEILFFAASTAIWNYLRLSTNEMVPFPSFLNVDFTTLYAALLCLFNAACLAFLAHYFRVKSRLAMVPCLIFGALAPICLFAGRTGIGITLVTTVVTNEFLVRGLIEFAGAGFAVMTLRAVSPIQGVKFRKLIAITFALLLTISGCVEIALQTSMWGLPWIESLQSSENRWLAKKIVEAAMASFGVAIAVEWALVVRDRQKVLQRFGMIIDPRVLKEIIRSKKIPSMRADRVVALFVDLRGFTQFCEKESPQEVNLTLNEYLEVVTNAVQSHDGIVDKFVGDEVMALWGIPDQSKSDPINAIRAAMAIRLGMQELNARRRESNRQELSFGIGIHCGPAIVGPVGTAQRIDFTAIGPTINLASRLQSLTKEKNADILISGDLHELVAPNTLVSDLGVSRIRGFDKLVKIFRLLGATDHKGQMHLHDTVLEAAGLPNKPGEVSDAPDNLFRAS